MNSTSGIQPRLRRARRDATFSPAKSAALRRSSACGTVLNALTLTTAYRRLSISLVTTGATPQREQMWNCAVDVPNEYSETRVGSRIVTASAPDAHEVHTPPCLTQKLQLHARAGISVGCGSHLSS